MFEAEHCFIFLSSCCFQSKTEDFTEITAWPHDTSISAKQQFSSIAPVSRERCQILPTHVPCFGRPTYCALKINEWLSNLFFSPSLYSNVCILHLFTRKITKLWSSFGSLDKGCLGVAEAPADGPRHLTGRGRSSWMGKVGFFPRPPPPKMLG